jgi:hypothetical protein
VTEERPPRSAAAARSEAARSEAARSEAARSEASQPSIRDSVVSQLGGAKGLVESSIPVVVFVLVNVIAGLRPALYGSVGSALVIALLRLVRREPVRYSINGLFGVLIAAVIAGRTGRAENFYLPGIISSCAYGLAFVISVLARWPLVGVIWTFLDGEGNRWREDQRQRRGYAWLTLLWAGVFLARGLVQGALYLAHRSGWLGAARLAMGLPLFGAALLITVWQVRRLRVDADETPATDLTAPPLQR